MRILWLAPEPPVPPLTGGRERARHMLAYLSKRYRVHLLTLAEPAEDGALQELASQLAGLTVVPYQARREDNRGALRASLARLLAEGSPNRLHVQGLDVWPGGELAGGCVLDLHDVPSLLDERMRSLRARRGWLERIGHFFRLGSNLRTREREALQVARAVLVTCRADARALDHSDLPLPKITILPNGVDLARWSPLGSNSEPATLLFPGALNWLPNVDAAKVLVKVVLPLVQQTMPEAQVILAGRRPAAELVRLAEERVNVTLVPNPADMRPLFARATLVVVPLRAATGTRLKILQALAVGRPVVSTPVGAAGLNLQAGLHLLVEPLGERFAAAIVRLLQDPALRQGLIAAGRMAVAAYDWPKLLPTLEKVYPSQEDGP